MASACGIVRGKPSNRKPLAQSGCLMRSLTSPMITSSGTSAPASMNFFACRPSGVPALTAARSMSPVEICGMPNFCVRSRGLRAFPGAGRAQQDQSHVFACSLLLTLLVGRQSGSVGIIGSAAARRTDGARFPGPPGVSTPASGACSVTATRCGARATARATAPALRSARSPESPASRSASRNAQR